MGFCTAISCIDGRVHLPVIEYLKSRLGVEYVDLVTEPGAVAIVAEGGSRAAAESIFRRAEISIQAHQSVGVVVVAHHDCAGNPVAEEIQLRQLRTALRRVRERFPELRALALWVGETWKAQEVEP